MIIVDVHEEEKMNVENIDLKARDVEEIVILEIIEDDELAKEVNASPGSKLHDQNTVVTVPKSLPFNV